MSEADEPNQPPQPRGTPPHQRRRPMNPDGSMIGHDDLNRVMGREPAGPKGQFSPKELSQVKDMLILILAAQAGSDYDKQIGMALMNGKELDPGQLRHIVDEAQHIQVPDAHAALVQKISTMCQG